MNTLSVVATLSAFSRRAHRPPRRATSLIARGAAVSACLGSLTLASCTAKSGSPTPVASVSSGLEVPCDARRVLESVCQQCHSNPTRNSAPFPLVTYDDTHVIASGEPLWHYMRIVVQSGVMPLPPVQLGVTDRETLMRWLNAEAPARTASDTCGQPVDSLDGGLADGAVGADSGVDEANANAEAESATTDAGASDESAEADGKAEADGLVTSPADWSPPNTDDAAPIQSD